MNDDEEFSEIGFQSIRPKEEIPKIRSVVSAPIKGILKGIENITSLFPIRRGPIPSVSQEKITESLLPIRDEEAENILKRLGEQSIYSVGGPGGLVAKGLQAGGAGLAGYIAEKLGLSPTEQNIAEILTYLRSPTSALAKSVSKIRQPRIVEAERLPKSAGFISTGRAQKEISRINQEASSIAREIGKEHPLFGKISKSIEKGHPIQEKFNSAFKNLEKTAKYINTDINSDALDNFLENELSLYESTGAPTELSDFISKEIKGWKLSGKNKLYNMFRRYRLNNERISEIYSTEMPSKLRNQKISFLTRMNNSINNSFQNTFSSQKPVTEGMQNLNSEWLNAFNETNRGYYNFLNTKQVKKIIDPIVQGKLTGAQIDRFLSNKNTWEDIDRFLGKEDSGKLKDLLSDIQTARNSIRTFPRKELHKEVIGHAILGMIPGFGKISGILSFPKIFNWAKGYYFSSPKFQGAFHDFSKALLEKNTRALQVSLSKMSSAVQEEKNKESDLEFEDIGFESF